MTGLDIFTIFVLLVLVIAGVAIWVVLAMLPGKIARERNHPQAEAVKVCGWLGGLTLGLIWPVAIIWAYLRPSGVPIPAEETEGQSLAGLTERISALEHRLKTFEQKGGES